VALNFFILALVIFVMVRQINRLKTTQKSEAPVEAAPITPEDVLLLREIRDSLKTKA
jgi:large conductance mechanosensitive channel